MVAITRQKRRDRQAAHIPSPQVWDPVTRSWIDNEVLEEIDQEPSE